MSVRSINEPQSSRLFNFSTPSINEPPTVPDIDAPAPVITTIEPTEATIGDASFTLYVTGENFFAGTVINFAGHDEPTTHNADGTVSTGVNMDVWHGADPGIVVFVHNGEKVSNEVIFAFHAPEETGLADPDDLEEEIAEAEEEGEFKAVRVSKTVTVKKK
jgi:hypothetical protein